jgi:SpoVK/Ycf46/Vps4 family AAA+-type ATPase
MGTYFSSRNAVTNRFFFVIGETADEFCDDTCRVLTIEWLLYHELRAQNYSRVIFYDKTKWRLYFYDDNSLNMTLGKPQGYSKMGKGPLKGFLPKDVALLNGQTGNSALNRGVMSVDAALNQIDACMRDEKIRTAIVINDADHFIRECSSDTLGIFTQYQSFGSTNENIVVFIFPQRSMESLIKVYERGGQLAWEHLCEPYFRTAKENNIICIGVPQAHEIRNSINNMRLSDGLKIKFSEMGYICNQLARACAKGKIGLKTLDLELKNFARNGKVLSADDSYKLLGQEPPTMALDMLDKLIGLNRIKDFVRSLYGNNQPVGHKKISDGNSRIATKNPPSIKKENLHLILSGNPGTGKTTVARLFGQVYYELGWLNSGHLVKATRSDLVSDHVGGTALKTREKINEAMGGVLFIDEAYALEPKGGGNDFGQEAINELVEAMTDRMGEFACIFAGYPNDMRRFVRANAGLESRVQSIFLEDYSPDEMRLILEAKIAAEGCRFSPYIENMIPTFCKYWVHNRNKERWANGREAEILARELRRNWDTDSEKKLTNTNEKEILKKHFPLKLRHYVRPETGEDDALVSIQDLVGLSALKKILNELSEKGRYFREHPEVPRPFLNMHWILRGNPGTGKTTAAKLIGEAYREAGFLEQGHTVIVTRAELVAAHVGGTALKTKDKIEEAMGGVLFIDEAYSLKQHDDDPFGQEAINTIIEAMTAHNGEFAVIVAGYPREMERFLQSNSGFRSRFSNDFVIEDYNADELRNIFLHKCRHNFPSYEPDDELSAKLEAFFANWLAEKPSEWGNGREVEKLFTEMQGQWILNRREPTPDGRYFLSADEIPERVKKYLYQRRVENKAKTVLSASEQIEKLIGFAPIKKELQKLIKVGAFKQKTPDYQYIKNMHWILRGNPGTGKTTVAKLVSAVYRESGFLERGHTVEVTRADLVAGYLGQTALKTREKIKEAMGGVLFIDEAYALKQNGDDSFGQEAIDTILEAMSANNGKFAVIVAGYPREMDQFLKSNSGFKSRFSNDFFLEDYSAEELRDIFLYKCETNQTPFKTDIGLAEKLILFFENWLSDKTPDWGNGREVEKLVTEMQEQWVENRLDSQNENIQYIFTEAEIPENLKKYLP